MLLIYREFLETPFDFSEIPSLVLKLCQIHCHASCLADVLKEIILLEIIFTHFYVLEFFEGNFPYNKYSNQTI